VIRGKLTEMIGGNKLNILKNQNIKKTQMNNFNNLKRKRYVQDPNMNKTVKIIKGAYKGYIGIVKDVSEEKSRIELHSLFKTITLLNNEYKVIDEQKSSSEKGSYKVTHTPYILKTPSRGDMTPRYENGSETPSRGDMTPRYGSETPRTPSNQDDVWNSKYPNTPKRYKEKDDEDDDNSKNPNTPIYSNSSIKTPFIQPSVITPKITNNYLISKTPNTIQTPGYSINTPGYSIITPNVSNFNTINTPKIQTPTINERGINTFIQTPNISNKIQTPNSFIIQTPNLIQTPLNRNISIQTPNYIQTPSISNTPNFIQTPNVTSTNIKNYNKEMFKEKESYIEKETNNYWVPGIEVEVIEGQFSKLKGIVKSVSKTSCNVLLTQNDEVRKVDVDYTYLAVTEIQKKDTVIILKGNDKGIIGVVAGIADKEVIVNDEKGNTFMCHLSDMAKKVE
jgi:transcription elongation factor